ncbi:glycosyltransferase [Alphaproteobacteria bacterium]|nr:glycosyltransferase [Alphaproteobacteria bacterium]
MDKNPLFSIILPTYNQCELLKQAIVSVLQQTVSSWELIILNNCSNDNTIDVVQSFKDSRIRIFDYANDGVIARSRNFGVTLSKGNFIAFLDSDDHWFEQKLEVCLQSFVDFACDIVCHGEIWDFKGKSSLDVQYFLNSQNPAKRLVLFGNGLSTSAVVLKRSVFCDVGGFCEDRDIVTAEDYDLWIRLAQASNRFYFIKTALGTYLFHDGGASKKLLKARIATFNVHRRHIHKHTKAVPLWSFLFGCKLILSAVKEKYISLKY